MTYRGEESTFFDFTGGMASSSFSMNVKSNQALLLRNVIINSSGGIEKRQGNSVFNSSAMVSSSTAVQGISFYKQGDGDEWLTAIAGTKIFKADSLDGTMDDITGAVTITSGQNNIWTDFQMNDLNIYVGGAPDAPLKWNGAGNAAALGGSPPSGRFGFTTNNRAFIGNTVANPSTIYWSILGNPEDWSGTGSGSQNIELNDGDVLVGAVPLNTSITLLFKQNSIHQLSTVTAPFPYFPLFKGVGAVGKNAIVLADGIAYFITPKGRMKSTDGTTVKDYPDDIDDIWSGLSQSRLQYIKGIRYTGETFDHLIWMCSNGSSTTNNLAIIWDLTNKCWLQHTTGYKANVATRTQAGTLYTGHYDGKIYRQDVTDLYTDASETSPGAIDGLWQSGWNVLKNLEISLQLSRLNVAMVSQATGSLLIKYGFNFASDRYQESVAMQSVEDSGVWDTDDWDEFDWFGQVDLVRMIILKGRGNTFQNSFQNSVASQTFKIHGYSLSGKKSAVKNFQIT